MEVEKGGGFTWSGVEGWGENADNCNWTIKNMYKKFYLFLDRGKESERNTDVWGKHWLVASCGAPTGNLIQFWNLEPGMYSARELNQQSLALWDEAQPIEPYQSELFKKFVCLFVYLFIFKLNQDIF